AAVPEGGGCCGKVRRTVSDLLSRYFAARASSDDRKLACSGGIVVEKLMLDHRRWCISTILIKRKHHGEAVPQGEVIPGEVKPLPALVRPDRADARPDFLALLVL